MKSRVLEKDFQEVVESKIPFDKFAGKTFFITGATGLIGSLIIKFLLFLNERQNCNIKVFGLVRNIDKANHIFKNYLPDSNLTFINHELGTGKINFDKHIDYIIHGASITQSKMMIEKPVETITISIDGTREVLDLAIKSDVEGMVYISSMEIYGQPDVNGKVTEKDIGELSLTNIRSGYPESKRLCELLCVAYAEKYGLKVSSARLAQTFGAGVLPSENRVFAQFARSVMNGENIVLHTEGRSEGNYVYTSDMIKAILTMLLYAKPGEAYNVTNEANHVSIKEMAQLVVDHFGNGKSKVIIDIPEKNMGYAPDVKMWLSGVKLEKLMGGVQFPTVDLIEMYRKLIEYLKE